MTEKSRAFMATTSTLFPPGDLWSSSAVRFFLFEDFMRVKKIPVMLHVEGDNLLYGRISYGTLKDFLQGYPRLAVTVPI
jgi:hypothetical protein